MKTTKLYELINENNCRCLYCNSICDFKLGQFTHEFTCGKCREEFKIHFSIYAAIYAVGCKNLLPIIHSFTFTCKDLLAFHVYYNLNTSVKIGYINEIELIDVPSFNPDFSDKEKLYQKLKTYSLFS